MSLLRSFATAGAVCSVILAVYYQLVLKGILTDAGYWRTTSVEPLNNGHCTKIPELQACEKVVRHHASGVLYFACSTPTSRVYWEPSTGRYNESQRSLTDYVATYNPETKTITRLKLSGFPSTVPLALHGFDVVPSDSNPADLWVYLVNHRPPGNGQDAYKVGMKSVIEVFKTRINSNELVYVTTVDDPSVVITPNDILGYGDGSFHFTNDARVKRGIIRQLDVFLRLPSTSVGYCHISDGCKIAVKNLRGSNGIARDSEGIYFVGNDKYGEIAVLEKQDDNTLVLTDVVRTGMPLDDISTDEKGHLYIAAFPNCLHFISETFNDPTISSPSAVLRLSQNTGKGQFYGEKYIVEKIFQDDGSIASASTSAVWDPKHRNLYLTGVNTFHVSVCKIDSL